ncbi:hypothetical protein [Rugosimonospora africana]|uniref:Uncharacterized protein n=1 Tax=Rugosimonospora africana TaxID=556532 RepID=A0A8J3VW37_9ACTN|nr:hypothetical protein [Rugosimonospora africana]GIH20559.1 hypothetical protein Raf01_87310 [Rugosimonospora africana]
MPRNTKEKSGSTTIPRSDARGAIQAAVASHREIALTGADPLAAADEAEQIINANLVDQPRSCVALWHGLLAEMRAPAAGS